ncbi:unnamed protein product [Nezara viridula]|uniref:Uncharacterized protein n=1 Tax=Nezara viridula TaxID=85310 RepID=A0A9P0HCA3_NEZVI|nr:unnamed protein product [Nezara viridula]
MNAGNSVFISCEKMKGYSEMKRSKTYR